MKKFFKNSLVSMMVLSMVLVSFNFTFAHDIDVIEAKPAKKENTVPFTKDDEYSTKKNVPLEVVAPGVLDNDKDENKEALKVKLYTNDPKIEHNGKINLKEDGSFEYTPNENFVGTDTFEYKAYNGKEYSKPTTIKIQVTNTKPVADAGSSQTVNEGDLVSLNGSDSSDANRDSLTYLWTVPDRINLTGGTLVNPTFTAPEVSSDTDYTFSLVVNDGQKDSEKDEVTITVKNIPAPSRSGGSSIPRCNPRNVTNGSVSSYSTGCVITCDEDYTLDNNECIVLEAGEADETDQDEKGFEEGDENDDEGDTEEGSVLGEKVWNDQLLRCEDNKIFAIKDNVKTYVPDWKTLFENYLGEDVNYATCEDIANIPEVLGDSTKNQCINNFKPQEGGLFRGPDMRIYAWLNEGVDYISSLERLASEFIRVEIFNICESNLSDLLK